MDQDQPTDHVADGPVPGVTVRDAGVEMPLRVQIQEVGVVRDDDAPLRTGERQMLFVEARAA